MQPAGASLKGLPPVPPNLSKNQAAGLPQVAGPKKVGGHKKSFTQLIGEVDHQNRAFFSRFDKVQTNLLHKGSTGVQPQVEP